MLLLAFFWKNQKRIKETKMFCISRKDNDIDKYITNFIYFNFFSLTHRLEDNRLCEIKSILCYMNSESTKFTAQKWQLRWGKIISDHESILNQLNSDKELKICLIFLIGYRKARNGKVMTVFILLQKHPQKKYYKMSSAKAINVTAGFIFKYESLGNLMLFHIVRY